MPHPERAIVGGAEHFCLIRSGDDRQSVHCTNVSRQRPNLLFGLDVPNLVWWDESINKTIKAYGSHTEISTHCEFFIIL